MSPTTSQNKITVTEVMHALLETSIHTTLHALVRKINWNEYSCIAVLDDEGKLFGIITEQLMLSAQKKKLKFKATHAWEIASTIYNTIKKEDTLHAAIDKMINNRVRYLIIEEEGEIKGIITALDILSLINWDEPRDINAPNS